MLPQIPRLEDYDISPITGFLPEELPLKRLSSYYEPWECIADDLPALILTKRLRSLIDKLPVLTTKGLKTEPEWRRAFVVLGFLSHGYVWASNDEPSEHLPKQLAEPWLKVSAHLELPPINTYAGGVLWNYKTVLPVEREEWGLDNLATLHTFTGCIDESWFYLVSTAIERQGGKCLVTGLEAIKACRAKDSEKVVRNLQALAEAIDAINTSLGRMYEMCDPHTFYFRIRPFLAGWKNMADAGLPNGVRYGDEEKYRSYSGGSNAQSSLIQALDILLNVEHHPTGEFKHRPPPTVLLSKKSSNSSDSEDSGMATPKKNNFIQDMRSYMPGPHRRFLEALTQVAEIRDYVVANSEKTPALTLSYDACLAMLRAFRDKHIQIVSRYIILQAREGKAAPKPITTTAARRHGLAAASQAGRGTGGTALIPFLKQARDETGDSAAGTWGKRLLTENRNLLSRLTSKRDITFSSEDDDQPTSSKKDKRPKENEEELHGLASSWQVGKNENGGVTHW